VVGPPQLQPDRHRQMLQPRLLEVAAQVHATQICRTHTIYSGTSSNTLFFTSIENALLINTYLETVSHLAIVVKQISNLPLNIQFPCSLANIPSLIARYA
jgi:hypothetical protein